jgi:A/G-specific adenine glycosylase
MRLPNADSSKLTSKMLTKWFFEHQRSLPWRKDKDPYRIWISEIMLQQTTVAAVVPFYERFLRKFPSPKILAEAKVEEVLEMWAGLGYYSRARNIHKSAQLIASLGRFPQTAEELLQLPGFGPYTARAVSSLAFGEKVGVLDGNVIRVLSRHYGLSLSWWKTKERKELQTKSDSLASLGDPWVINQALMELGATVCTSSSPVCLLCPLSQNCVALKTNQIKNLPLVQPKRKTEIWVWQPRVKIKDNKVALIENNYAPFLKGQWLFPGEIFQKTQRPKDFDIRHSITHHDIFIQVKAQNPKNNLQAAPSVVRWVRLDEIKKVNPTNLVSKVLSLTQKGLVLLLFIASATAPLIGCSNKPVQAPAGQPGSPTQKKIPKDPALTFLNLPGQQTSPQYSPSGEKLIYVSWDRSSHQNRQIYEYDLTLKKETRLTFQDGLAKSPSYWDENSYLYSSNTDEIKENFFSNKQVDQDDSSDIYLSEEFGEEIHRLTSRPGRDDQGLRDPWSKDRLFFVSGSPKPGIYSLTQESQNRVLLINGNFESYFIHKGLRSLIGLELVGIRTRLVQINLVSKRIENLPVSSDSILAVSETPWAGLLLIAEPENPQKSQIFFWNAQAQCITPWRSLDGRITHLQSSPKGNGQFVVSTINDQTEKILILEPPAQTPTCGSTPQGAIIRP